MLKGDPLMRGAMLALPARRATYHSRKYPPNLGQVKSTVVTGELERNERACLSLTLAAGGPQSGMSRETSLLSPSLTLRPRWARTPGCSGSDLDYIEPYPGLSADQSGTP